MLPLTIALLLAVAASASANELPDYLRTCPRNSPDLNQCITDSIAHIRPYLVKGIPELKIPPLEPLLLEELVAVQGGGIKLSARDINTFGASDFSVTNMNVDLDNLHLQADVSLPNLYVDGKYFLEGKILLLPLSGSGPMRANFSECAGTFQMKGEIKEDDAGVEHIHCSFFDVKVSVGDGNIYFDNLFGGEKALGEVINSAINSNFDIFVRELKPLVEKALSHAFQDIANNILSPFSFKQLIPDS